MDLHVATVVELCEAFRENRTHHRDHMRNMITQHLKPMILAKWGAEVEHQQRTMFNLLKEMEHLDYHDEEILAKCFQTMKNKKRINNLTFFDYFNKILRKYNTEPSSPFFQQLDGDIAHLKEKHFNANRKWRYDFEEARQYSL